MIENESTDYYRGFNDALVHFSCYSSQIILELNRLKERVTFLLQKESKDNHYRKYE